MKNANANPETMKEKEYEYKIFVNAPSIENCRKRMRSFLITIFIIFGFFSITHAQIVVTNTDDAGTGSLRWAVDQANATSGTDIIQFNIPGDGPHYIRPESQFISFLAPVEIDGSSQPGYTPGSPEIVLDGSLAGDVAGLVFTGTADNSSVKGLSIINYESYAIRLVADNVSIQGNLIGIDPDGNAAGNDYGISMINSVNNQIGGTVSEHRNIISGNNVGIDLGPGSGQNVVEGNYIGTNLDATQAVGNKFNIQIIGSINNRIGGSTPEERNIVAGAFFETVNGQNSGGSGIVLSRGTTSSNTVVYPTGNEIKGNYIGTDVTGTVSLANERGGVLLLFGATDNTVGGENTGEGNLISGNGQYGIFIQGSETNPVNANFIQGNYIGTDVTGTSALPNNAGIWMMGNNNANLVGASTSSGGGNLISGNSVLGILILEGTENQIMGNLVGTDHTGTSAVPNPTGIEIRGDFGSVGGPESFEQNVISGNTNTGIYLSNSVSTQVEGNLIGLNISGDSAIDGQSLGVRITGGSGHLIVNNTISGHSSHGIRSDDAGSAEKGGEEMEITGNRIGTDAIGLNRIANTGSAIFFTNSSNNRIGGEQAEDRNILSGNGGTFGTSLFYSSGIVLSENSNNNQIMGNYVGTNNNGDVVQDFGNSSHGIVIQSGSSGNVIGLDDNGFGAANLIAGNGLVSGSGIMVKDQSTGNRISENRVYSNFDYGIDLGDDGITNNDSDDSDSGPNELQNYPVLQSVVYNEESEEVIIDYSIPSDPSNSAYPIEAEFYINDSQRQGKEFFGRDLFQASDFGTVKQVSIPLPFSGFLTVDDEVTALSISSDGNTSEFSAVSEIVEPLSPPMAVALLSPADETTGVAVMPVLSWEADDDAESYSLQVSTTSDFSTTVTDLTGQTVTQIEVGQLDYETQYYWRVRAVNEAGAGEWSDMWSFTTEEEPLSPPMAVALLSPADEATGVAVMPVLSWEADDDAETYSLQVSTTSDFSTTVTDLTGQTVTKIEVGPLGYDVQHYWRVKAVNEAGESEWSEVWSFTTEQEPLSPPGIVQLTSPEDGAEDVELSPLMDWEASDGATSYHLQVSQGTDFEDTVTDQSDLTQTEFEVEGLSYDTQYFWRVKAANEAGESEWSEVWSFTTEQEPLSPPGVVQLTSPEDGAEDVELSPLLDWEASDGATSYHLQVSQGTDFEDTVTDQSDLTQTEYEVEDLGYDTQYFWRVKAANESGESDWSEVWSFTTENPVIVNIKTELIDVNGGVLSDESSGIEVIFPENAISEPTDISLGFYNQIPDGAELFGSMISLTGPDGSISFNVPVQITLTYDPDALSEDLSEEELKLLRYTESTEQWGILVTEVNLTQKTLTAQTTHFSGFAPGILPGAQLPGIVELVYPSDESSEIPINPTLSWSETEGSDSYDLQISEDNLFSSFFADQSGLTETVFDAENLQEETLYYWRVRAVNEAGAGEWSTVWSFTTMMTTSLDELFSGIPHRVELGQNYPNPFNPTTSIQIALPESGIIRLEVFDMLGRQIGTIVDKKMTAGRETFSFDASNLPSGTYIYRLETATEVVTRKMMLIK